MIWLDNTLFHIPKSQGSYIEKKTGRLTSNGNMAKAKNYNQTQSKMKVLLNRHQRKFVSVHQNALYVVQQLMWMIKIQRLYKQLYIVLCVLWPCVSRRRGKGSHRALRFSIKSETSLAWKGKQTAVLQHKWIYVHRGREKQERRVKINLFLLKSNYFASNQSI